MSELDYLGAIDDNAAVLVAAARTAGLDAPVPSCPDWTVADLLRHIGTVHRWAAAAAACPPDAQAPHFDASGVPDDRAELPAWVRSGALDLVDTLGARDPDTPAWTWAPPATIGFWRRRQAHETTMHRIDAQLAAGAVDPVEAHAAADAIDEWAELSAAFPRAEPVGGLGETVHLHCIDVEGEWLVRLDADGMAVERRHAKGDAAVRGDASALLFWLMGRAGTDGIEIFGDATLLARLRTAVAF